jgi:tyrosinase
MWAFGLAMLASAALVLATAGDAARGEQGRTPAQAALTVRPDVADLTPEQRRALVDAILALKQAPAPFRKYREFSYYDMFVQWHRNVFFCGRRQAAHMGSNFLPWHREFLLLFEQALNSVSDTTVVLPYWDWTDPASTNAVFRTGLMGGDGDPDNGYAVTSGPFRKGQWRLNVVDQKASDPDPVRHLVRSIGTFPGVPDLPTAHEVQNALTRPVYDTVPFDDEANIHQSFRNNLEGWRGEIGENCKDRLFGPLPKQGTPRPHKLHNAVHLWVGGKANGTMDLNTSPNDPVFWLHHANIDRLWESWAAVHGRVYEPVSGWPRPGENLNNRMVPYKWVGLDITPASMLDPAALGYSYAELTEVATAEAQTTSAPPPALGTVCRLPRS